MANETVRELLVIGHCGDAETERQVMDAMWSDVGRMVYPRVLSDDLVEVVNRAGLRAKSTREMVGYIRAYILTGSKP